MLSSEQVSGRAEGQMRLKNKDSTVNRPVIEFHRRQTLYRALLLFKVGMGIERRHGRAAVADKLLDRHLRDPVHGA